MKSRKIMLVCVSACFLAGMISCGKSSRENLATALPSNPIRNPKGILMEKATFAAGCFWGVEETFRTVEGVLKTTVGYSGGTLENPTYEEVCTDRTGHAEVVLVEYDPAQVSYEQLLDVFWSAHDPTTLNRQGPDSGKQYRSAIFYHTPAQKVTAEASKERLSKSGRFKRPIVTEITAAAPFYPAEEYHQQYLLKRGKRVATSGDAAFFRVIGATPTQVGAWQPSSCFERRHSTSSASTFNLPTTCTTGKKLPNIEALWRSLWATFRCAAPMPPRPSVASRGIQRPPIYASVHI